MSTTVNDIEGRYGHDELVSSLAGELSKMVVKGELSSIGTSTGDGKGDSKDSVSTDLLLDPTVLGLGAINFTDHLVVDSDLVGDVHTLESGAENVVDVGYGLEASLAEEAVSVLISKFESLVDAGGGA